MDNENAIASKIRAMSAPLQAEIGTRNSYIQERDGLVYGDDLFSRATFMNGGDRTRYNWLERLVDIHVSQLMGRSFQVHSTYTKRDTSMAQSINDPQQQQNDDLLNQKSKTDADARGKIVRGMILDNGGDELFQTGAASGSAFGYSVYKSWLGDKDKAADGKDIPWHIEMLENIQNYQAIWSGDNFREKMADIYVYQINPDVANSRYSSYLREGEQFKTSMAGNPMEVDSPIAPTAQEGNMPMVTVLEYTGILPGYKGEIQDDGTDVLVECDSGDETKVNVLLVGDCLLRIEADEDKIPRYYIIPNKRVQRRPWGYADVTPTCIDINVTYLERMSDWITLANKTLFQKYKAKGFDAASIPAAVPRKVEMIPMDADQDIEEIAQNTSFGVAYSEILNALKENFVRSAGISQVLFDNPQMDANSNQALMTTMKGMIDTVEKKQKIWSKVLIDMFEDALRTSAKHFPDIASFVPNDEDWQFVIKWPSIMRADDPAKQTMDINEWNTGNMSVESFLERRGVEDPSQEIDRIRDDMKDNVLAAIRGQRLPSLAELTILPPRKPTDPPLAPQVKHTFNWSLTATPEQAANIAETVPGMQDGPFGQSSGPQGPQASRAANETMNKGLITGAVSENPHGTPVIKDEKGNIITGQSTQPGENPNSNAPPASGQNTVENNNPAAPGIMSQPGSAQPTPATPAGNNAKNNQNQGK